MDLRLTAVGDALVTRRLSAFDDEPFISLVELIRGADVSFANLEMLIHDYDCNPAAESGGTYMAAPPYILDELRWSGFDLLGCANNHSGDYGEKGLLRTIQHLKEREWVFAGIGANLAEARAPDYLETPKGRVALLSAASSFSAAMRAGPQRPDLQGRPGLNPLRYKTRYHLPESALKKLRSVSESLGLEEAKEKRRELGFPIPGEEDGFVFVDGVFIEDDEYDVVTEPRASDMQGILKWIDDARRQADWVIFSMHAHEGKLDRDIPADFLQKFARACIDAGVDAFIGHGPHVLRGVELYRGKPILYSLGNFLFQNETVFKLPGDIYERYDLGQERTPADVYDQRTDDGESGFPAHREFWESVVAEIVFKERELVELKLHPIGLGHGRPRSQRGRPVLVVGTELGEKILDDVERLSEPFGTVVEREAGVGVIRPRSQATT
jgi:poly-gamma-glutamate synthesis protein (capsule biosynthesis protein)